MVLFQFSSVTQSCPTLRPMGCSTPGLPVHHQLPEFTQTHVHESVMPSNHLILCRPLLLLLSIFSSIRVFSNELVLRIRWPKYWSFSFSISPSNEYSGLISFRMDWLDLLAVQGTLKSLFQYHFSLIHLRYNHSDAVEKEMANYSSILAWEIPETDEPGGLQSMEVAKIHTQLGTAHSILMWTTKAQTMVMVSM